MLQIFKNFAAQSICAKCLNIHIHIYVTAKVRGTKICIKNATWDCAQKQTFTANTHTTRNTYLAKIANMKNMQKGR
jgi:hypothetical protein